VFNLTRSRHFPSKATGKDIECYGNYGPGFSGDGLVAYYEPFNGNNSCWSNANRDAYKIPLVGEINQLTNQKDGYFTIS
jgi:hypothetical protein